MCLTFRGFLALGQYLVLAQKVCIQSNTFIIFSSESSFLDSKRMGVMN